MPRSPNEKAVKAKQLYDKGMKLVDIAKQLDTPPGTVRRWKSTYDWDNKGERSEKKASVRKQNKGSKKEPVAEEVTAVLENTKLTDKQRLFCIIYVRCFNATKAYQKAYGVDYNTAASIGYRLLEKDGVREQIAKLKQNKLNRELLSESDIFQKYMDIAFADISDYLEWGTEERPILLDNGTPLVDQDGNEIKRTVNTVLFKGSTEVDGTLISEVKQGRDGASLKLADRMRALDWLAAHMDLATPEQKAKVDMMNAQRDKLNGTDNNDPDEHVTIVNDIKDMNE